MNICLQNHHYIIFWGGENHWSNLFWPATTPSPPKIRVIFLLLFSSSILFFLTKPSLYTFLGEENHHFLFLFFLLISGYYFYLAYINFFTWLTFLSRGIRNCEQYFNGHIKVYHLNIRTGWTKQHCRMKTSINCIKQASFASNTHQLHQTSTNCIKN